MCTWLENVGNRSLSTYVDNRLLLYCPPGKLGFQGNCVRGLENGNT